MKVQPKRLHHFHLVSKLQFLSKCGISQLQCSYYKVIGIKVKLKSGAQIISNLQNNILLSLFKMSTAYRTCRFFFNKSNSQSYCQHLPKKMRRFESACSQYLRHFHLVSKLQFLPNVGSHSCKMSHNEVFRALQRGQFLEYSNIVHCILHSTGQSNFWKTIIISDIRSVSIVILVESRL